MGLRDATIFSVSNGAVEQVTRGPVCIFSRQQSSQDALHSVSDASNPALLLICGSFSYPLISQPVLRHSASTFILPASATQHFVLHVSGSVSLEERLAFEAYVREHTELRTQVERVSSGLTIHVPRETVTPTAAAPESTVQSADAVGADGVITYIGTAIATTVTYTGRFAAAALVTGAEYTGYGLQWTAEAAKTYITPQVPVPVSNTTRAVVDTTRHMSAAAVSVTNAMAEGASAIARSLGADLASAIMASSMGDTIRSSVSTETGRAVSAVAHASVGAVNDLWLGMDRAAVLVSAHLSDATSDVVTHTYGSDAGDVARTGVSAVVDAGRAAIALGPVSVVGVAKAAALQATVCLADDIASGDSHAKDDAHRPSVAPALMDSVPAPAPAVADMASLMPTAATFESLGTAAAPYAAAAIDSASSLLTSTASGVSAWWQANAPAVVAAALTPASGAAVAHVSTTAAPSATLASSGVVVVGTAGVPAELRR